MTTLLHTDMPAEWTQAQNNSRSAGSRRHMQPGDQAPLPTLPRFSREQKLHLLFQFSYLWNGNSNTCLPEPLSQGFVRSGGLFVEKGRREQHQIQPSLYTLFIWHRELNQLGAPHRPQSDCKTTSTEPSRQKHSSHDLFLPSLLRVPFPLHPLCLLSLWGTLLCLRPTGKYQDTTAISLVASGGWMIVADIHFYFSELLPGISEVRIFFVF